jgi:hypothetical protein
MRLTKTQLRQLIKEEVQAVISEGYYGTPVEVPDLRAVLKGEQLTLWGRVPQQVVTAFKQAKAACKQHEKAGRVLATLENAGLSFSCVVQKM